MVITGVVGATVYLNDPGGDITKGEDKKERDMVWFNQYLDRSVGLM